MKFYADPFAIEPRGMSTDGKHGMIINKLEALNKMLKNKHYGDTGPSTEQEMDLGIRPHSGLINIELQAQMDEFAKMKMEDGRNQDRSAPLFEEMFFDKSLENIEEFLKSEEPEDPDEREKRRQEGVLIERDVKLLQGLININFGVKGTEKRSYGVGPSSLLGREDLNADIADFNAPSNAGSTRGFGVIEFDNNEDMNNLHSWAK